jgi:2-C-methyl-D-erythritol 4-phosphate cytidylyltransferase/2-C-methyl-D-erythritol 2,4-cyclodiphosphate synthase
MNQCHALIPCAGSGQRFGGGLPKQYQELFGRPMVHYCIETFIKSPKIKSIWVATSPLAPQFSQGALSWPPSSRLKVAVTGGNSRHQTVLNTLNLMIEKRVDEDDWVLVHDAARPGISLELIHLLIDIVTTYPEYGGGILALPVADTLKTHIDSEVKKLHHSTGGISREGLWQAQTPQMFRVGELRNALDKARLENAILTDEASAFERMGKTPFLVQGSVENLKITYERDFVLMEKILKMNHAQSLTPMFRVGQGYDVHQLVEGRPLVLGGVEIPNDKGLLGHSDADALLHAIIDALLGSVALGDIGRHFPDTDPKYKGANSSVLLKAAYEKVKDTGYIVGNIDSTIICQSPKLGTYIPLMAEAIAKILKISAAQVNIKAKTNENLGYLGAEKAIETQATVFMIPRA